MKLSSLGWLGTIGSATALALAAVFTLATVVAALTATLAFAIVLALAGVLVGGGALSNEKHASGRFDTVLACAVGCGLRGSYRAANQTSESGA